MSISKLFMKIIKILLHCGGFVVNPVFFFGFYLELIMTLYLQPVHGYTNQLLFGNGFSFTITRSYETTPVCFVYIGL